jgi:hypothetical protein
MHFHDRFHTLLLSISLLDEKKETDILDCFDHQFINQYIAYQVGFFFVIA